MVTERRFEVEFLEAARGCGASLQKALALPGLPGLCRELAGKVEAGTWRPGRHARFAVEEPKLREIFAPCFADRIVEAWLVSHMEPFLERLYIDDSYANRKGKGPLAAIRKAQKLMRQPDQPWCLQLDIKSFFCSLYRPTLLKLWLGQTGRFPDPLRRRVEFVSRVFLENDAADYVAAEASRALLNRVPPGKSLLYAPPDTGLPIGSVASQHFANFALNGLDHFVKHKLRVKGYLRYMDDLLLLGPNPASLTGWRDLIADYLRALRLELHPGKEKLQRADKGIEYLGYRVYPHHMHLCSRTVGALNSNSQNKNFQYNNEDIRNRHPVEKRDLCLLPRLGKGMDPGFRRDDEAKGLISRQKSTLRIAGP